MFNLGVEEGHHAAVTETAIVDTHRRIPFDEVSRYYAQDHEYQALPWRIQAAHERGQHEEVARLRTIHAGASTYRSQHGNPGGEVRFRGAAIKPPVGVAQIGVTL